jgi:hypothetical protein
MYLDWLEPQALRTTAAAEALDAQGPTSAVPLYAQADEPTGPLPRTPTPLPSTRKHAQPSKAAQPNDPTTSKTYGRELSNPIVLERPDSETEDFRHDSCTLWDRVRRLRPLLLLRPGFHQK